MVSFYWQKFFDERPVAHIYDHTNDEETPGGTPCKTTVGICGDEMLGYATSACEWNHGKTLDNIKFSEVDICRKCLRIYNSQNVESKINLEGIESILK